MEREKAEKEYHSEADESGYSEKQIDINAEKGMQQSSPVFVKPVKKHGVIWMQSKKRRKQLPLKKAVS